MKIAVCDDETQFIDATCSLLEQWANERNIALTLYRFTNGDDLIAAHQSSFMDLIILDVVMPLLSGLDTAKELRKSDRLVPILFLTVSREFAVDSYEVKALNYLIKPVSRTKLFSALDDFLETLELPDSTFTAQTASGFCKLVLADIDYLEAQNKQVIVHQADGGTVVIRELFSTCAEVFSPENGFCRCHRSYIMNLSRVAQFTKTEITTTHNAAVPISRDCYAAFKEAYFSHMFS